MPEAAKPHTKSRSLITWRPFEAIGITILIYFAAQYIGGIVFSFYPVFKGWSGEEATKWLESSALAQFLLILLIEAATLSLLYTFLRSRKATFKTIGLVRIRLRDFGYAVAGLFLYIPLFIGTINILTALIPSLDVEQKQQLGFEAVNRGPELILVFASLVLLPAAVEEIVVRGFLYSGLKNKWPTWIAVIVTSILFAAAHLQFGSGTALLWVAALDTFVLSVVLIWLREVTDALWAPIGLHMLKNSIAFISLFILTT